MKRQRCDSPSFSKTSRNGEKKKKKEKENLEIEWIPFDLVNKILLRLSAKSIHRFRSVSKQWGSTLDHPDFPESFLAISSSRPKPLFTCLKDDKTFFFSSLPNLAKSSPLAVDYHMSFPINNSCEISRPVRGLVCGLNQQTLKGRRKVTIPLICNPSTGQSLTLPKVKTRRKGVNSFFGYDPIDKQFKILCMTQINSTCNYWFQGHQVMTLRTQEKLSWRMIICDVHHGPIVVNNKSRRSEYDGICINGVLYYMAYVHGRGGYRDIVCFDVRSEKFKYIKLDQRMQMNFVGCIESTLVNYKGKLAMLEPYIPKHRVYDGIQLWVLEDAETHQWLSCTHVLPPLWKEIVAETKLRFVGINGLGEIVLSPDSISESFYLLYYNPESNTITKVEIQGMEAFRSYKAYTFLDHVEDLKFRIMGS